MNSNKKKVIKIKKKEYRRKKLKWLEGLNKINRENMLQNRDQHDVIFNLRMREFEIYKERARLDMELGRIRLMNAGVEYALDKMKADEKRTEERENEEEKTKTE